QVISASMRWSVRRPFSVDMRSARATPAPPVVMVGYSPRVALATTFVGLMFAGLGETDQWHLTALIGLLMVLISGYRVARTASRWEDPATQARARLAAALSPTPPRVVVTVAGSPAPLARLLAELLLARRGRLVDLLGGRGRRGLGVAVD